jgi:7,8-dihydro-6-hydroxymethylpterin-pyrophosphokinase
LKKVINKSDIPLPTLAKINDDKTKLIQRAHESLSIRLKLIDFYLNNCSEASTSNEVRELILMINDFTNKMDRQREYKKNDVSNCVKL